MSIKGSRAAGKNLGTLVECSENGEDLTLPMDDASERQGTSCSVYETASSKFSTNGEDVNNENVEVTFKKSYCNSFVSVGDIKS